MTLKTAGYTAIILVMATLAACKKTKNTGSSNGTFYLHMHTNIDTNEVDDNTTFYTDAEGRHLGLTTAQYYITNVTLHNVNGTFYTLPNSTVLVSMDSEQYKLGDAPAGTYDYVQFTVGLSATMNAMQPTAFVNNGYLPNSDMWFGATNDGYNYLKIEGFADTTAAQTGINPVHFSYHIGKQFALGGPDLDLKTVIMPLRTGTLKPYTLFAGSTAYVHIVGDYGQLLSQVNFKTTDSVDTHAALNPGTAVLIANNTSKMFRYEE